jgi:hypothetical protein
MINQPPRWFYVLSAVALLWNLVGLFAVVADLRLTAADIAALPLDQQALYRARPGWSVIGSVAAVVGGSLGCVGLLLRRRWALVAFAVSLVGIVIQNIGIFGVADAAKLTGPVPIVLQTLVLLIGVGLLLLARMAAARSWFRP